MVAGLTTTKPVDALAPRFAEAERTEIAEELMSQIHGGGKNGDRRKDREFSGW